MTLRVLAVSQVPPWPTIGGGYHRVASQLRALARATGSPVDLLLIRADVPGFVDFEGVRLVADVTLRPVTKARVPGRRFVESLVSRRPLGLHPDIPTELAAAARTLPLDDYDLHWVFRAEFADAWPDTCVPLVVDLDDIESKKVSRGSAVLLKEAPVWQRPAKAFSDSRNSRLWARLQSRVVRRAAAHLVCASNDIDAIDPATAFVVPNTIVRSSMDTGDEISPFSVDRRSDDDVVLFHGKFTYAPNADAAAWLVRQIAPRVWERNPSARFRFAGRAAPDLIRQLSIDSRVEFLGFVPDMWQAVSQATIVVAPIRFGGGTRLKLIEAAATGAPIVSTTVGAEGLPFTPGENIILADEAADFASEVSALLNDGALRARIGSAAQATYAQAMSQGAVDRGVQEVLSALQLRSTRL